MAAQNCCDQPAQLRKSLVRRYFDLFYASIRWNELSSLYFAQKIDLKGRHIGRDFLSYGRFRELRDAANRVGAGSNRYNYGCLLQDKLLFERYYAPRGIRVAESLGSIDANGRSRFSDVRETDLCEIGRKYLPHRDLFVKPRFGIKGKGVFKLRFDDNHGIAINDTPSTCADLMHRITATSLVQARIPQHAVISQLHPESLNTLRVITFRRDEVVEVFLAYLRMAGGGEVTDNNSTSRAVVRVNEDTGQLFEIGYALKADLVRTARCHPDTGIVFSDVVIPDIQGCLALARAAHEWTPGLFSIGWDIAITPAGPVLLEGNDDWGATLAMFVMPEFSDRFLALMNTK